MRKLSGIAHVRHASQLRDERPLLRRFRSHSRLRRAPMAGVASYMRLPIREFGVDVLRHGDHVPRDLLVMLFVACEIALYVTEVALLLPTQP